MIKNNNKGFTLIELLAIIVILAIIAVITVPIIINIIENSKKGAAQDSAYGFKDSIGKYYVDALSENKNLKLEGEYTVSDGNLTGKFEGPESTSKTVPILVSGDKPSSGSLTYSNNILTEGCLVFGDYAVTFEDGKTINTEKGDCSVEVVEVDFTTDSWPKIIANLNKDRSAYDDEIGKTKIIEFDRNGDGTNEYYKLRLVNTSPCSSSIATSKTSCGVVIDFVTLIGTHNMNSLTETNEYGTNEGGWKESAMRRYLNTDTGNIFSKLPSDLQNVIIGTAPIVSGSGSGGVSDNVVASTGFDGDKLYLLSGREIGENSQYDNKNATTDTNILKYYEDSNSSRIKHSTTTSTGVDGSASWYWLRSAISDNTDSFLIINGDASSYYRAYDSECGVAPAFRIMN